MCLLQETQIIWSFIFSLVNLTLQSQHINLMNNWKTQSDDAYWKFWPSSLFAINILIQWSNVLLPKTGSTGSGIFFYQSRTIILWWNPSFLHSLAINLLHQIRILFSRVNWHNPCYTATWWNIYSWLLPLCSPLPSHEYPQYSTSIKGRILSILKLHFIHLKFLFF